MSCCHFAAYCTVCRWFLHLYQLICTIWGPSFLDGSVFCFIFAKDVTIASVERKPGILAMILRSLFWLFLLTVGDDCFLVSSYGMDISQSLPVTLWSHCIRNYFVWLGHFFRTVDLSKLISLVGWNGRVGTVLLRNALVLQFEFVQLEIWFTSKLRYVLGITCNLRSFDWASLLCRNQVCLCLDRSVDAETFS